MGSKMFLLLVLGLFVFTDHSQGVPEMHEKSSAVSTRTDASAVGEPQTTAAPISLLRHHNRLCNCKVKGMEMVKTRCVCQQSARRNGKHGKFKTQMKTMCQRKKNMNLKKCRRFFKPKKGDKPRKPGPSTPI